GNRIFGPGLFWRRGALQYFELLSFFELIKMVTVARGGDVHIQLSLRGRDGLRGNRRVLAGQFLQRLEDVFGGEEALLQPALFATRVAHANEAAVVRALEDVYFFAVHHRAGLVVNGGDAVAQRGLDRGDVGAFERGGRIAAASEKGDQKQ